jgi:hypothetical protein
VVGDRTVVIDSVGEYQATDGSTTAITSYTVELPTAHQ